MRVDKGLDFCNKHVKALGVELYSTENEEKSCVVELWNRTMKDKMFKYFLSNSTRKCIDILNELVNKYNNTKHSSIKMTPVAASDKRNQNIVSLNLNGNARLESVKPKFSIDDRVRIIKKKGTFEKEYKDGLKRIEKVIRKLKNKSLVKWNGNPESFNSWLDNKELISLKISYVVGYALFYA
ncbi:uncharacterized protein LOC136085450 [Hydra vulgaris]|uniref:Uncharacterized protein LOC136085450 n=1 Tax=Hydra vulgaris TaxID=6087 RepID=A0ABM4CM14_HYDVU